jgi:asparagine synthase (glutamine-hydrolysing)
MRRLSIIDVSGGDQPISNEDGSVWTVFNGEIYNFRELRSNLQARGHRFRTATDTEVIVHAYEEFGDDFVQRCDGMFAFALWDSRRKRLILARDRVGIKQLYYTVRHGQLIWGSEIKCRLAYPVFASFGRRSHSFPHLPLRSRAGHGVQESRLPAAISSSRRGAASRCESTGAALQSMRPRPKEAAQGIRDRLDQAVRTNLIPTYAQRLLVGGIDSARSSP